MKTYDLRPHEASFCDAFVTRLGSIKRPKTVRLLSLREVVAEIRGTNHKETTERLQRLYAEGSPAYSEQKVKLPSVVFGGDFAEATDAGLRHHSGLMVLDFDRLPNVDTSKAQLADDPHTVLLFTSPSGAGLKWIVRVEATDAESHKACFQTVDRYAFETFGLFVDQSGKNVSRHCFIPHDPNLVIGKASESFKQSGLIPVYQSISFPLYPSISVSHETMRTGSFKEPVETSDFDFTPYLPDRPNANHNGGLFSLARKVIGLEKLRGSEFTFEERAAFVQRWFEQANPDFRPNDFESYEAEFFAMLKSVKTPLLDGEESWQYFTTLADRKPPPIAQNEQGEVKRRIISLTYHLSDDGKRQFPLPQKLVAAWVGRTQPLVSQMLDLLEAKKLIKEVKAGRYTEGLAAEYIWTGPRHEN